ncbi:ferrous iron transport protein A [Komarekiella sp. 'clone 1']|uniref:Ferrous iron transport protein A n=1 Tax=Komarekiella delphini-convector SJRDD-AB1 TaxID=2593771 RepID=A0AA40VTQ7_9NOST|nr:FeoA family protein [Komarekiella delphini-convector]MBD6618751.1 ferrous iron transport protein A [Komarekiella delphini-convector SJRDD-AB1]
MYIPFSVTGCSLELLRTGEQGIVVFSKTHDQTILEKLRSMGITPGTIITLEQQFPSAIIQVGNILFPIDQESIRAIYVRVIDS